MAGREQVGLRGPVKMCKEEVIYPAVTLPDKSVPERTHSAVWKFDREGRTLTSRMSGPGQPELVLTNSYDEHGRLLRSISKSAGVVDSKTRLTYDAAGRVLKSVSSGSRGKIETIYSYDETGRKIATHHFDEKAIEWSRNVASSGLLLQPAQSGYGAPAGGSVRTLYNESDQPTEAQVFSADGKIARRLVRSYDEKGRITGEKQIVEDPELIITPQMREQILANSGGSVEDLRARLHALFGGKHGLSGTSYAYAENRLTVRTWMGSYTREVTEVYNEHGDASKELTMQIGSPETAFPALSPPGASSGTAHFTAEVRHEYQYDSHGNWTERKVTGRPNEDDRFQLFRTHRRKITYY